MRIVLCNCPEDKASSIARSLVEEQLAACVNIIPGVKSVYQWQGKICEDQESTLLIKIRNHSFAKLKEKIQQLHPYEVPEIVELNVADVNQPYIKWLYEVTKP